MKRASSIINIILCALLAIGVMSVFRACSAKSDGTYMSCHYAQLTVYALSIAMFTMSIVSAISLKPLSTVLRIATIIVSIVTAIVPGNIIHLCMMNTMRCRAIMRPFVILMSVLIAVFSLICVFAPDKPVKKK